MKTTVISVDKLSKFLELEKHKFILQEKLRIYLKEQELQLDRLRRIKEVSQYLLDHKGTEWWDTISPSLKKQLEQWRLRK